MGMDKKLLDAIYGQKSGYARFKDLLEGLFAHEQNDAHDARYYTKAEVDGFVDALQFQITSNLDLFLNHKHYRLYTPDFLTQVLTVDASQNITTTGYIKTPGIFSYQQNINNNQAVRFGRSGQDESFFFLHDDEFRIYVGRLALTSISEIFKLNVVEIKPCQALTGTTGLVGDFSISCQGGDLWVENRTGSQVKIVLAFVSIMD